MSALIPCHQCQQEVNWASQYYGIVQPTKVNLSGSRPNRDLRWSPANYQTVAREMSALQRLEPIEPRSHRRYEAWKNGLIGVRDEMHVPCLVENVSESGALTQLSAATALPQELSLFVPEGNVTL